MLVKLKLPADHIACAYLVSYGVASLYRVSTLLCTPFLARL